MTNRKLAQTVLNCINELVYVRDSKKNILFMNRKAEMVTGWTSGEAVKKMKCFEIFGDSDGRCEDNCPCDSLLEKGVVGGGFEKSLTDQKGRIVRFIGSAFSLAEKGMGDCCIVVLEECLNTLKKPCQRPEEHLEMKKTLLDTEEKYRQLLESIEDGYYEIDLGGNLLYCNDAMARIYGVADKDSLKGINYRVYTDEKNAETVFQVYNRVFSTGKPEKGFSLEIKRPDGITRTLEVSISLTRDGEGKPAGFRGIVRDITERRQAEERLKYLSMHDAMTGLYNRTYFEEEMARLNSGRFSPVTIICCDLDGLKQINDNFGHKRGDDLLKTVAEILKGPFRSSDVIARVGGDEFAVILPKTDEEAARLTCERLKQAIETHNLKGSGIPISLSIGRATGFVSKELTCDELYRRADNDMYRQKLQSKPVFGGTMVKSFIQALESKDFLARGHAQRTLAYANKLGTAAGLSRREMEDLKLLAQFHDIGKAGIVEAVLFKREPLTQEEWGEIKQHSEIGYRIARSTPELSSIADWILYHHEWWNGQGYPLGLKGQEIPLLCRVFSIAEAYEVITSGRPYREAVGTEEARRELERGSGTQFDPDLIYLFINILAESE